MTDLRKAAKEALWALQYHIEQTWPTDRSTAAIAALRAALAQQDEPAQEPVAWMVYTEGGTSAYVTDNPNDLVGAYRALALYTAPPQRKQAEPDHETRAELAEQQVVQLAEERDHYRNLWQKAQQAEPAQEPVAWVKEYAAINAFYGSQVALRSQLPLIRHIDDGLHILHLIGASALAKAAFCLHPIVQNNETVDVSWSPAHQLACEYRDKANAYLCRPDTDYVTTPGDVRSLVGNMSDDCRSMLIADKRQNYGDFIAAHFGKHARSEQLDRYFRLWLSFLEGTPTPPQRKPLTDEEIRRICDAHWSLRQLARAIERAHGIKE